MLTILLIPLVVVLYLPGCAPLTTGSPRYIYINSSSIASGNLATCGRTINSPCRSRTFDGGLELAQSLLLSGESSSVSIIISVAEGQYVHDSDTNGIFSEVHGLSILGEESTTVTCNNGFGFSFTYCTDINIRSITFIHCGQLQSSTSYNFDQNDRQFINFFVGLYFLYCRNVNMTLVTIRESNATGIVLYNVVGNNLFDQMTIFGNKFDSTMSGGGGGGMYIEYSYCVPDDDSNSCLYSEDHPNVNTNYTHNASFYITDSTFTNNSANTANINSTTFILPHKQYHDAFGRGGGLSIFFKGNSYDISIIVDNCTFTNNEALWGGGIYAEFQDRSHNNTFLVRSSLLSDNSICPGQIKNEGTSGGGARVDIIFFDDFTCYDNNITFTNCNFTSNKAYYGGGLSFYSIQANFSDTINYFQIEECNFDGNSARVGSALDLSLWHSAVPGRLHPVIKDCTFANNSPSTDIHGSLVGIGAMYVDSLPVSFKGNISFIGNNESALAVTGSYVVIKSYCNIKFYQNSGRNGGAIALFGNTFILTSDHSNLTFINNTALYKGGAIYFYSSGERDSLSSRNCFIRFKNLLISPYNWTSKFYFENNVIQQKMNNGYYKPNSIYASSVLSCIWGATFGESSYNNHRTDVFCWNSKDNKLNWIYKSHSKQESPCSEQISSAPTSYSFVQPVYHTPPGKRIKLNLSVIDDDYQDVTSTAIFIARITSDGATFNGEKNLKFNYISHGYLNINGRPNSNVTVVIETLDPIVMRKQINITLSSCPPGFQPFDDDDDGDTYSCVCNNQTTYYGYVQCTNIRDRFVSQVYFNAWIGLHNNDTYDYVAGITPYFNSTVLGSLKIELDSGTGKYLTEHLCGPMNRTGVLCGSCVNGTGVAVISDTYHCIKCHQYSWIFYMLATYLPITIFFILMFVFSMPLTRGPLNSFIFFAQVITTTVDIDADGGIPLQHAIGSYKQLKLLYKIPYSIWNLNFFRDLMSKFCFSTTWNTLDVMLLSYTEALYLLVLLVVIVGCMVLYGKGVKVIVWIFRPLHYCLVRVRQWTNSHQSKTGGIAVFIIISYTKFNLISMRIMNPIPLYDYNGTFVKNVHYFDGDFDYPQLQYIIPAIVVLVVFGVLPSLLLIYSSVLRFVEWISRWRLKLGKLYPPLSVKLLLDEFHGCYKDGSDETFDCRWFAGFYFMLRLGSFAIYTATPSWESQYIIQALYFLIIGCLFAIIRPYKKDWINTLDTVFFILLSAISSISLYNLMQTWNGSSNLNKTVFVFQYILIIIPLFYCIGYYVIFFGKNTLAPCVSKVKKKSKQKPLIQKAQDGFSYCDGLVDSAHVSDFINYVDRDRQSLSNSASWEYRRRSRINQDSEDTPLLIDASTDDD